MRIRFDDIPADVVALAKTTFSISWAWALLPRLCPAIGRWRAGRGRSGQGARSTAFGFAAPVAAAAAALRNGALMHSLEYDGTHTASVAHAGSVVAPVALAVCEETGASGAELLRAFVLGWEMFVRLGPCRAGILLQAWIPVHRGGRAVCSRAHGGRFCWGSIEQMTNALGIAGSQASGVMEFVHEGATVKALHAGWPAHAGLLAARLAEAGHDGAFEHPRGRDMVSTQYMRVMREAPARLRNHLQTLGEHWHLRETALKVRASCHYIQPFLECLGNTAQPRARSREHCGDPLRGAARRGELDLRTLGGEAAALLGLSGEVQPALRAWCAAGRTVTSPIATFEGPARPEVCARAARVTWSPMADGDFPNRYGARLTVTTRSNEKLSAEVTDVRGTPGRPFAPGELSAKFYDCARRVLQDDAPEQLAAAVDRWMMHRISPRSRRALRCVR